MERITICLITASLLVLPITGFAASFSDVPATDPLTPAVAHLVSIGAVTQGGAFRPNEKLTRAQAVKMLLSTTMKASDLEKITFSSFPDVPSDAWYMRYAEAARMRKIVSASSPFNPEGRVTKAAFIKMLLIAKAIDAATAFSDINNPLSSDAADRNAWYYAPMRYAVASAMTAATKDGLLLPSREITRGDSALIIHRFDQFVSGDRTQVLLIQTESEIARVLQLLGQRKMQDADTAAARAVLTARGALTSRPHEPVVQAALKIAKGFQSLVQAYKAVQSGKSDAVIMYAKEAYAAAEKAEAISPGLAGVSSRMRSIAKRMADEAREQQKSKL